MFYFEPGFMLIAGFGLVISMIAAARVKSAFAKYSQVPSRIGYTAAQAARVMLERAGVYDVEIVPVQGTLTDHYDPAHKRLALSEPVYHSRSVAALGIACHEAGHALQHAERYPALGIVSALWRPAAIGSQLGFYAVIVGAGLSAMGSLGGSWLAMAGLALFGCTLAYQVVTLPVEFDASNRAKQQIVAAGIIAPDEIEGVNRVLNAAAMTYVAAAVTVALQFAWLLVRSGLLGSRNE
jgi:Zn-dependent membrane protease YugP